MDGYTSSLLYAVYSNPSFPAFGKPCDTHLKTDDGTELKVYSELLSKDSKFFNALFSNDEECGQSVVIHGIQSDILERVLIYLYNRHIDLNTKNMLHLLAASDFLMIEPLILKCRKFVLQNINQGNCIKIFLTAYRIKNFGIEEECRRFVLLNFEKAVKLSKKAYDLPYNCLKYFLSHRSINVSGERVIWSYIEEWVKIDESNRLTVVPKLLSHLYVNDINNELASSIITSSIIRNNELYKDLEDPQMTLQSFSAKQEVMKIITYSNEIPFLTGHRLPRCVYFVTKRESTSRDVYEMFISYDDRLDVWRLLYKCRFLELHTHTLLKVGHRVYIFQSNSPERRCITRACIYDIYRKEISPMAQIRYSNFDFPIVLEAAGNIYSLHLVNCPAMFQRYVRETNEWTIIAPFPNRRIRPLAAVSLNDQIYVLTNGNVMWVYDPSSSGWKTASSPGRHCYNTGLVAYQGKIFRVGGFSRELVPTRSVRVYDPTDDEWAIYPEVPFDNDDRNAGLAVVNEQLFVYKKEEPYSVAYWDGSGEWKLVDDRSSLRYMCLYSFCRIEEEDVVRNIVRTNRKVNPSKWIKTGLGREMLLKSND